MHSSARHLSIVNISQASDNVRALVRLGCNVTTSLENDMAPDNETDDLFAPEDSSDAPSIEDLLRQNDQEIYTAPADPDIQTILGRIDNKALILHPEFQRASVWDKKRQSRLIESLMLNLPIPPCFLAEDEGDEEDVKVVVDGQQRLMAVHDFYHGRFVLEGLEVLKHLNGKVWDTLPPKMDRKILGRVIRTLTISHHTHPDLRFIIFERLNTGAVPLVDQEIRNATLGGSFNKLLNELATNALFKELMRISEPDARLRHHELVLRFFAINAAFADYKPPLKLLLTKFMRDNRKASPEEIQNLRNIFLNGLTNCKTVFGANVFRKYNPSSGSYETQVSRALFDMQVISLSQLEPDVVSRKAQEIETAYKTLFGDDSFAESLSRATDHRTRFYSRQRKWLGALEALSLNLPIARNLPLEG